MYDAIKTTKQGPVVVETHDIADYHGKFGEYRTPTRPQVVEQWAMPS